MILVVLIVLNVVGNVVKPDDSAATRKQAERGAVPSVLAWPSVEVTPTPARTEFIAIPVALAAPASQ